MFDAPRPVITWAVAALVGMLAAPGCARPSGDPVRALVDELVAAGEARDADRVLTRLSDSFRGQETLGKVDVQASLRRYFAAYESIDLEVFDVVAEPAERATRVRTRIGFSGKGIRGFGLEGLLPPSAVYLFDLDARDEGGTWRVTRASWEVLAPGPPSAQP